VFFLSERFIMRQSLFPACLLAVLVASPAFAISFDMTPDPTRDLADPTYLPTAGQITGGTRYSYSYARNTSNSAATGATTSKVKSYSQTTNQKLGYGITDWLTLRAEINYTNMNKRDINNLTSMRIRNADGFSNPSFGATWRVLDQRNTSPVSLDVFADYSPDMIKLEQAGNGPGNGTVNGSVARGGPVTSFGSQVSYRMKSFTVAASAGAIYFGDREIEVQGDINHFSEDDAWAGTTALRTQTRFTDDISFDLGARYTIIADSTTTNLRTGVEATKDSNGTAVFSTGLNYDVVPNRLVLGLTYDYNLIGESYANFANPALTTRTTTDTSSTFGVNLRYNFN